jgi:uncharacterized membrane protein YqaE (UPF0057 family)
MLFCGEMRRSTIWFLIACLWLIDVVLNIARGHGRQVWLTALVTLAFFVTGIIHRSREGKTARRRSLR